MLEKAKARKNKLEDTTLQPPHRLKYEPEIIKLRVKMVPLLLLESIAKDRSSTVKETKTLARKVNFLSEIEELDYARCFASYLFSINCILSSTQIDMK